MYVRIVCVYVCVQKEEGDKEKRENGKSSHGGRKPLHFTQQQDKLELHFKYFQVLGNKSMELGYIPQKLIWRTQKN